MYPLPPDMTCSFLIQPVFCIKICLRLHSVTLFLSDALPPKKNPGSAPAENNVSSRHSGSCFSLLFLNKYFVKIKRNELASAIISVLAS